MKQIIEKIKNKAKVPEVKAALFIIGGILSVITYLFMIAKLTDFTIIMTIVGFIFFLLYKLWEVIVNDIKNKQKRSSW